MKLRFLNGLRQGEVVEFRHAEITIGRDEGNDLQLDAGGISRCHVVLRQSEDRGWLLADQNSTNGTKINGKLISGEKVVFDGDVIAVGEQDLELMELSGEAVSVRFTPLNSASAATVQLPEQPAEPVKTPAAEPAKTGAAKDDTDAVNSFKILEELKQAGGALFKKGDDDPAAAALGDGEENKRNPKRMLFNVVFYVAIVVLLVSGAMMFLSPKEKKDGNAAKKVEVENISVYYENVVRSKDGVPQMFRVELVYDNGKLSCRLNDVVNGRAFEKIIPAEEMKKNNLRDLNDFVKAFKDSSIGGIDSIKNDPVNDYSSCERMIVIQRGKVSTYRFYDDSGIPDQVRDAKSTLLVFADKLGMQTTFKTRQDIEKRAADLLVEARRKHDWFDDDFSRLREAKRDYEMAMNELNQLNPTPGKLMSEARRGLDKVTALRKRKYSECQQRFRDASSRQDYQAMEVEVKNMLELANEDSPAYGKLKKQLFDIQQYMSRRKQR
ncbi:MAG: FHA domain-containing protein [Lentisphaeria bacterium]|nr:FHA domain-containing protein [Lentisphaeria bacterium]